MLIVDAQVHAWKDGEATGHHRKTPITAEVLMKEMEVAGVDRALMVPPLWDPTGNDYSLMAAQAHPDVFAVMGLLQFGDWQAQNWQEQLPLLIQKSGLRGLRFLFNSPERIRPFNDGFFDGVWPVLQRESVPVALLIPNALNVANQIAQQYPDLQIIVDHLGVPRGASGPDAFAHLPELLALAKFPNICVKAAGVGDYAPEGYPFASLDEPLRKIFDTFGPERIIWASELSRLHHPYRQCVTHFLEEILWLSDADRSLIMGENLCRILGWNTA